MKDIEDIPFCSGAVVRSGLTKTAVYRDENGQVHTHIHTHANALIQSTEMRRDRCRYTYTHTQTDKKEGLQIQVHTPHTSHTQMHTH